MNEDKGGDKIPDAYDVDGRPLYYHPPTDEAIEQRMGAGSDSEENPKKVDKALVKLWHDRSVSDYPFLDLEKDEYVEVAVVRHKIGLIMIWVGEVVAIVVMMVLWVLLTTNSSAIMPNLNGDGKFYMSMAILAVCALMLASGWIGTMIYMGNCFIVTNRRAIQKISSGLFDKTLQTIVLISVEDVSYRQSGFFQTILGYGSIRLSTVGDETTYQFNFVLNPSEQVKSIVKVVNAAKKKGRGKS